MLQSTFKARGIRVLCIGITVGAWIGPWNSVGAEIEAGNNMEAWIGAWNRAKIDPWTWIWNIKVVGIWVDDAEVETWGRDWIVSWATRREAQLVVYWVVDSIDVS